MKKLALICAVLLLSACGSDSKDQGPPPVVVTPPVVVEPPVTPPVMVDPYIAQVEVSVNNPREDTEAANLDAIVATMPEDTEPKAL